MKSAGASCTMSEVELPREIQKHTPQNTPGASLTSLVTNWLSDTEASSLTGHPEDSYHGKPLNELSDVDRLQQLFARRADRRSQRGSAAALANHSNSDSALVSPAQLRPSPPREAPSNGSGSVRRAHFGSRENSREPLDFGLGVSFLRRRARKSAALHSSVVDIRIPFEPLGEVLGFASLSAATLMALAGQNDVFLDAIAAAPDLAVWQSRHFFDLTAAEEPRLMSRGLQYDRLRTMRVIMSDEEHVTRFANSAEDICCRLSVRGLCESGAVVLARRLRCLQWLDLSHCHVLTDAGVLALGNLRGLRSLSLANCLQLTDAAAGVFHSLSKLESLDVSQTELTDRALFDVAVLQHLSFLSIQGCGSVGDQGLAIISSITSLRTLDISWCWWVTNSGIEELCKLAALSGLRMAHCERVTDSAFVHVGAKLRQLRELDITECGITDVAVSEISRLPHLQSLSLSGCWELTDTALACIAAHLTTLRSLNLSRCVKLTNAGVAKLAANGCLRALNFSGCRLFGDDGMKAVSAIRGLLHLNVSHCPRLTDEGIQALMGHRCIKRLNVVGCTSVHDSALSLLAKDGATNPLDVTRSVDSRLDFVERKASM